jgi:16S rRNA processing protein RimM
MRIQDCVLLGTITKTHGVDGKVVLQSEINLETKDFREPIFITFDGLPVPFFIITADRKRPDQFILTLELVPNVDEASRLVGHDVFIPQDDALLQNEFDLSQLVGLVVIDQEQGEIGTCQSIDNVAGNYLLSVSHGKQEVLIPFAEDFIVEFIPEENYLLLDLPEGLLDLN